MKLKINFDGNLFFEVTVASHQYTLNERLKRTLKTFIIFFGCAVLSILIPVLHFFLVPLFLILSLFLSYRKYQEIYSIDLRELQCPVCKNHLNGSQVGLKESDLSIRMPCESCRKSMTFIIEQS